MFGVICLHVLYMFYTMRSYYRLCYVCYMLCVRVFAGEVSVDTGLAEVVCMFHQIAGADICWIMFLLLHIACYTIPVSNLFSLVPPPPSTTLGRSARICASKLFTPSYIPTMERETQLYLAITFDMYIWHVSLTFISDISIWHLYLACGFLM
jgi:hypothetical protein